MAKHRRVKYRITSGTAVHDVRADEFDRIIKDGFAVRSEKNRHLAHLKPRYKMHVDRQTGHVRFDLTETPVVDPAGVRSWWNLLVGRHEFYFGRPSEVLYLWAAQAESLPVHL